MSPARLKEVNEELDRMLSLGVVVPSKSGWSSPIVLLDKPDGSKRFCVDFRRVNAVTRPDAYPLPQVTTILDRLRDAKYLSSLDIKSAYWQIPLSLESRAKTAFTVPGRGLFEFVTMPFGLHNAPATWQRFIDSVIGADLEPHVFVYLDDIIVITNDFDRHLEVLQEICHRLRAANITLNLEKCKFCRSELRYLGYIVDVRGLHVDPEKVQAILKIPTPTSQKAIRQFCGTASWYRRFIPNFADRMYPLTSLLRKKTNFVWTAEANAAFEDIRSCLIKAPILTCPDFTKPFTVSCDASGLALGAYLSQNGEQGEQVIAYASRTLSKCERKFSATERECLAVIWAVERFRPYIEGTHFTVITDHYSLLWLHNLKDPQGRLARWALRLQPYNFTLVHRRGKEHVIPDMLSRAVVPEDPIISAIFSEPAEIKDKWYLRMLKEVARSPDKYPSWRIDREILWKLVPNRQRRLEDNTEWKRVIPKQDRHKLLTQFHDEPTAGHLGSFKTYSRILSEFYWPKMRQDVSKYVSKCQVCNQSKVQQLKPAGEMGSQRIVDRPWSMIAADLIGPLPRSSLGHKYILVVTDTFTKFVLLFPLRAATATLVAKHLENDVFLMWGKPNYLICDNGSEFEGKVVKKLAEEYNVRILYNASRHPQANPAERVNKTIGNMLRSYVGENHRNWDKNLSKIAYALRTAKHETTNYTPAYLNFGRELNIMSESDKKTVDEIPPVRDSEAYARNLAGLRDIYTDVIARLRDAHEKNAKRYNLRRRNLEFKEGDLVWKRNFALSNATEYFSAKLAPKFVGPFTVVKRVTPLVYILQDQEGRNIGRWHVSDLKPYV